MRLPILSAALILCGAAITGCAASAQSPAKAPAEAAATSAPADPTTFAAGVGQDKVTTACAACHPATMVTAKRYSEDKWAEVVDQMISKGAKVSDADYDVIVTYLAKNYGDGSGR